MLVCSVASSQLRVLSFKRQDVRAEHSPVSFSLMSWSHVSGWPHNKHHRKCSITRQFHTCQPCSCGADRPPLPVSLPKSDVYRFTNLSQTRLWSNTIRPSLRCFHLLGVYRNYSSPLVAGMQLAIAEASAVTPSIYQPHCVLYVLCCPFWRFPAMRFMGQE